MLEQDPRDSFRVGPVANVPQLVARLLDGVDPLPRGRLVRDAADQVRSDKGPGVRRASGACMAGTVRGEGAEYRTGQPEGGQFRRELQ